MPVKRVTESLQGVLDPQIAGKSPATWTAVILFLIVSLGLASLEHFLVLPDLPTVPAKILLAISGGIVGTIAYCLLAPTSSLKNIFLISAPYLFVTLGFLFSDDIPTWDSHDNHFPFFQYIAQSLADHDGLPTWLPVSGGIDFGIYHLNYFPFLPHRLVGYLVYSLFPVSTVWAYKFQLLLGVLFFALGWYAVIATFTRCQSAAFWGTLCVLMGGAGITFHQEQVIASCHLLPWFTYCLLKACSNRAYILPASALFGLGLSSHYPQIQLISMSLVTMAILLWRRPAIHTLLPSIKRFLPIMGLLLLLGSLPSLYVWHYSDDLASGARKSENLRPTTYDEYVALNKQQISSAPLEYFSQFVKPDYRKDALGDSTIDSFGMFVGRASLLLIVLALVIRPAITIPIAVLLLFFFELTLGINSNIAIPKLLFYIKFPFIHVFRQWYHFFPFMIFCLSLLAAIGFIIFNNYCSKIKHLKYLPLVLIFLNTSDFTYYDYSYLQLFAKDTVTAPLQESFISTDNSFTTFMYKDRFKINNDCINAIPNSAFITTKYLTTSSGIDKERSIACEAVYSSEVVTNLTDNKVLSATNNRDILDVMHGQLFPQGITYNVFTPIQALFVSEINYSLNAEAFVDDNPVTICRVSSALSGLILEPGEHRITFKKTETGYFIIVMIQLLLYFFVISAVMFLVAKDRKTSASNAVSSSHPLG